MPTKTGFKGALTKDIVERITLKDILKERRANEKRMKMIMDRHKKKMKQLKRSK